MWSVKGEIVWKGAIIFSKMYFPLNQGCRQNNRKRCHISLNFGNTFFLTLWQGIVKGRYCQHGEMGRSGCACYRSLSGDRSGHHKGSGQTWNESRGLCKKRATDWGNISSISCKLESAPVAKAVKGMLTHGRVWFSLTRCTPVCTRCKHFVLYIRCNVHGVRKGWSFNRESAHQRQSDAFFWYKCIGIKTFQI